ncbi:MAG: TonB-dependent receptor plug domain-containing protein, partial [Pseudomonadota bacterium]
MSSIALNTMRRAGALVLAIAVLVGAHTALAHDEEEVLSEIVVVGRATNLLGAVMSASRGYVGSDDLASRPILRPGELLEVIPGAAVTQHSGVGKANQYFLRGFNLDHGTDFAAFVDGIPLNTPTHGHGQGYLDLNPIIPELVETIEFGKGPYYTDVGDFSSAGYVRYTMMDQLAAPMIKAGIGENGFLRSLLGGSTGIGLGDAQLLAALELQQYDGPWELDGDAGKVNGMLRMSGHVGEQYVALTGMAYSADWTSTDQVPTRAIEQGLISRLGNIDPTLGGESERYSVNLQSISQFPREGLVRANAYFVASELDLFSNFTYFLNDPVNGDQINQRDRRWTTGVNADVEYAPLFLRGRGLTRYGVQVRHDRVREVALLQSTARTPVAATVQDRARITSTALYGEIEGDLTPWARATAGLRGTFASARVDNLLLNAPLARDADDF